MGDRYRNQIIISGFGKEKQDLLAGKRVLIVGAGGLGSEATRGLAAAGIGELKIIDGDRIETSNLQRQWLYGPQDVGRNKAEVAANRIEQQFPVRCIAFPRYLSEDHASELVTSADLVLDCTDNLATRRLIDRVCYAAGVPWIYAALHQTEAYWCFMNHPEASLKVRYDNLFPEKESSEAGCHEQGVFSLLPAITGLHQATLAVRYLSGWHNQFPPGLFHYNLPAGRLHFFNLRSFDGETLHTNKPSPPLKNEEAIMNPIQLRSLVNGSLDSLFLIDIRPVGEEPVLSYNSRVFAWDPAEDLSPALRQKTGHYVLFCGSGKRSASLLSYLSEQMPAANLYSLEGGIRKEENFRLIQEYLNKHA